MLSCVVSILLPCAKHIYAQVAAGELCHAILDRQRPARVDPMSKFKIKVARIETVAGTEEDTQVRITFQVDRGLITFQVPIRIEPAGENEHVFERAADCSRQLVRAVAEMPAPWLAS
jgi:hypothetical protein